jgi:WD40 repeat protein/energy-coupling factor transporter ATP-binding protein EcfA2
MATWFISHSKLDPKVAAQIIQRLRAEGHESLFLSSHPTLGIQGGADWESELYRRLRSAVGVVFLASKNSVQSQWCFAELCIARSLGRVIIPFRLEGTVRLRLLDDLKWISQGGDEDPYGPLAAALRQASPFSADDFAWDPSRSPYPGLGAFGQEYAGVFFGRAEKIAELLELLRPVFPGGPGRFVAVVGPSGSGKSSLLRAGLLPRLQGNPEQWVVLPALLPGSQPITSLAQALADAGAARDAEEIEVRLVDGGSEALVELARKLARVGGGRCRVLVVIDQAEELSTRTGPAQRLAFLDLLRGALRPASPLWVVATVRSEFLSADPNQAGLADAIDGTVIVEPLSRARLPEVIEQPARRAGLRFPSDLVALMVDDTVGGDALPLLAHTLEQLYRRVGKGGTITVADYESLGGVAGCVQREADRLNSACHRQGLGKHVLPTLLKLTNLDASGLPTRRRVDRASLTPEEDTVAQAFIEARLLNSATSESRVRIEVAHEALLRQWTPLCEAIEASGQALRARSELERQANDWVRSGHGRHADGNGRAGGEGGPDAEGGGGDESYLLHGGRLEAIERWLGEHPGGYDELGELERRFLEASRALARRTRDAQQRAARVATRRSLLFQAESLRGSLAGTSLLLGIEAMRVNPSTEARASLVTTLVGTHYRATLTGQGSEVPAVAFSPDGRILVTGGLEPALILWDVTDPGRPRQLATAQGHIASPWAVAFSPDGKTMATGGPDTTIILWDVSDPAKPSQLATIEGDHTWVRSLALSPVRRLLLAGRWDNTSGRQDRAALWDISDPRSPRHLSNLVSADGHTGPVRAVTFCIADSRVVATGNDNGTVLLWNIIDPTNPRMLTALTDHANSIWALDYNPKTGRLLSASADRTAILWDLDAILVGPGEPVRLSTLTGHTGVVRAVAFSPDGTTALTGSWDNTAILWRLDDPERPVRLDTLGGHSQPVHAVAFSPAATTVATASDDRTTVLWDVVVRAKPAQLVSMIGHTGGVSALAFSSDGHTMASGSEDGSAILWDVTDRDRPQPVARLTEPRGTVFAVAFSLDGRLLVTGHSDVDGTAILWDVRDPHNPRLLSRLTTLGYGVASVSVAPDGRTVATGCNNGNALLWDISEWHAPRPLATPHTGLRYPIRGVPFSPDGRILVTASTDMWTTGYTTAVWDLTDRNQPRRLADMTDGNSVYAAVFSPNGRTLALAEEGRKTTLWDLADPANPQRLVTMQWQASSVFTVGFSPDGNMIATGGYDKTAIVWDVTDQPQPRKLATLAGSPEVVSAVAFSPDGRTLAVSGGDYPVLWDIARLTEVVARPLDTALAITGRGLDPEEWERYAPDLHLIRH